MAGNMRGQRAARLRLLRSFTTFVPPPPALAPAPAVPAAAGALAAIEADLDGCTRCRLSKQRKTIVFGVGRPDADLMFIGEGPGAEEDRRGEPFVGRAGRLLDRLLDDVLGIRRDAVYIANIVKCRPPGNRDPRADEVATCLPFLERQIAAVRPKALCLLGRVALATLFPDIRGIGAERGKVRTFAGTPVVPTYHPAYLLRLSGAGADRQIAKVADDLRLAWGFVEKAGAAAPNRR